MNVKYFMNYVHLYIPQHHGRLFLHFAQAICFFQHSLGPARKLPDVHSLYILFNVSKQTLNSHKKYSYMPKGAKLLFSHAFCRCLLDHRKYANDRFSQKYHHALQS